MKDSDIYKEYVKSGHKCSFEKYLFDEYNLMKFYFEQSEDWGDTLGHLIYQIHQSGQLKDSEFADEIRGIYIALDA